MGDAWTDEEHDDVVQELEAEILGLRSRVDALEDALLETIQSLTNNGSKTQIAAYLTSVLTTEVQP